MEILVVGGGVQGLAIATALAEDGHLVQLLERERPGQRASWVAAGLLTPSTPWKYPPGLVELCHASEELFGPYFAALQRHTGIDPEYEQAGILYPEGLGFDAAEVAEHSRLRRALGFHVERLDRAALDRLQPGTGPELTGAAWQPLCGRVRPPRLLAALKRRADQLGVAVASECEVGRLVRRGERVIGVEVHTGQRLLADLVVLAAGAWSSRLAASAGVELAVHPVRGQILLLRGPPGLLGPTINDGEGYLVPRRDGRILVGSTMEEAGFEAVTTEAGLAHLCSYARRLLPATDSMEEELAWAGLRPGTPDRLPYIGAVPGLDGLILATGHFRNGILLAPITASIVADLVAGRAPGVDIAPFRPDRRDAQAPQPA